MAGFNFESISDLDLDLIFRSLEMEKKKGLGSFFSGHIRARFRSWDLWVMGPPRFRCATLISCQMNGSLYSYLMNIRFYSIKNQLSLVTLHAKTFYP